MKKNEQVMNIFMNKSRTSHKQVMNKSSRSREQVMREHLGADDGGS